MAQGEGNFWYFGYNAGLDFNTNPPTPLTNGALNTNEGCAAVSDKNGNLLFYTDGRFVYDKNHNLMPNGAGLMGHPSSTQSAIIVPRPGTYNYALKRFDRYFIFTIDVNNGSNGVRYSEVDMTLNGGLGDVLTANKNTWLFGTTTTEKIAALKHSNDCDYWVVGKPVGNTDFYAYLVTSSGVNTTPVISSPGPSTTLNFGYMKASPDNKLIAMAHGNNGILVCDFDNTNGILTRKFDDNLPNADYGIEFSPNSQLLYAAAIGGSGDPNIYQYDLTAPNNPAFQASRTIVGTTTNTNGANYLIGALQLAPNGKIYVALPGKTFLGVINNPDVPGTGCNYTDMAQSLGGRSHFLGLPTFPSTFNVPPNKIISKTNPRCQNDSI